MRLPIIDYVRCVCLAIGMACGTALAETKPVEITVHTLTNNKEPVEGAQVSLLVPDADAHAVPAIARGLASSLKQGPHCVTGPSGSCILLVKGAVIEAMRENLKQQEEYLRQHYGDTFHHNNHGDHEAEADAPALGAHGKRRAHAESTEPDAEGSKVTGTIAVSAEGFLPVELVDVDITAPHLYHIELERGGRIMGLVQDRQGRGYAGVRVTLDKQPEDSQGAFQLFEPPDPELSGSQGRFSWDKLPAGDYLVTLDLHSADVTYAEASPSQWVRVIENQTSRVTLTVEPQPKATLEGTLRLTTGQSIRPQINATTVDKEGLHQRYSGHVTRHGGDKDQWRFTVSELPPGDYKLLVQADGLPLRILEESLYVNGESATVNVGAYTLLPGAPLQSLVIDSQSGSPIADARVRLLGSDDTALAEAATDADGRFFIENIAPGAYRAQITAEGYAAARTSVNVDEASSHYPPFHLEPTKKLLGSISPEMQASAEDIEILLMDGDFHILASAVADETGRFKFEHVPTGELILYLPQFDQTEPVSVVSDKPEVNVRLELQQATH